MTIFKYKPIMVIFWKNRTPICVHYHQFFFIGSWTGVRKFCWPDWREAGQSEKFINTNLNSFWPNCKLQVFNGQNRGGYIGCSLNIVIFFENLKIYSGLWPLSVFPRCVHRTSFMLGPLNGRLNTSAAAVLAESKKSKPLKEKTQYLMNTL